MPNRPFSREGTWLLPPTLEELVPADHAEVHHHPLAVREVRRILMEHLKAVNAGVTTAGPYLAPVSGTGIEAPP